MDEREQQRKVRHRLAVLRHADEMLVQPMMIRYWDETPYRP